VTSTEVPSRIAATRAWVAMLPIALACVTSRVHAPAGERPPQERPARIASDPAAHGHREHLAVDDLQGNDRAALNPAGTRPPDGRVMPAGAAAAGARGAGRDAAGAARRTADGACAVPHPAASPTISRPPHMAANVVFIEITSYEMTPQAAARLWIFCVPHGRRPALLPPGAERFR
jgi:hypothetical protein